MPDSEAKRRWMREHSVTVTVKLMRKADGAVIDFIDREVAKGRNRSEVIKSALRAYVSSQS